MPRDASPKVYHQTTSIMGVYTCWGPRCALALFYRVTGNAVPQGLIPTAASTTTTASSTYLSFPHWIRYSITYFYTMNGTLGLTVWNSGVGTQSNKWKMFYHLDIASSIPYVFCFFFLFFVFSWMFEELTEMHHLMIYLAVFIKHLLHVLFNNQLK